MMEPTPKKHALGKLTIGSHACTVAISLAYVQRMVNCVTRDLYCHGGLQGDGLEVDILLVASHILKKLLKFFDRMGLPSSRLPM